ncbi:hypothetical protein [Halorarius halobius]|uniref:hypothetical protein n=1 Tax=Halorarius halobius TaxID=2962671 RepID=UPI0020CDAE9C|nr:hypothetical protein [Halorarius halobius]
MRRRSLLAALPATVALAGCSALSAPDVRAESGTGVVHPADPLQIANGLQPGGNDRVYATVVGDESPNLVTEATDDSLADTLRNDGGDVFHLVMQLRSIPDAPMSLMLTPAGEVRVQGDTLHAEVTVEPRDTGLDDEELGTAEELIYTSVWSLTPALDSLPTNVDLHLTHR